MKRKAFVSAVLVVMFGAAHQAVTSQNAGRGTAPLRVAATHAGGDDICTALRKAIPSAGSSGENCIDPGNGVLFIIATAPNPANAQLALSFDRTVDVIQRAAGDRGFLFDRFVFPWDAEPQNQSDPDKHRQEEKRRADSESRPGLLLFRNNVADSDPLHKFSSLAVLLVPENPSSGVNADAFRSALEFVRLNTPAEDPVYVLGPGFSSSAASLRSLMHQSGRRFVIRTGSATVNKAWQDLSEVPGIEGIPSFLSTVRNDDQAAWALYQHLQSTGSWSGEWRREGRIATLSESQTLYGAHPHKELASAGPLNIVFPRGISWVRNAWQDQPATGPAVPALPGTTVRLLPFSMGETGQGDDKPPSLSGRQTPVSEETALMNIAATLHREDVRFVVIRGTDPLDNIFLMRFLRTHCPDLRIIVFESDLLYVRAASEFPMTGVVLVTSYPLFTRNQHWTRSTDWDDRVQFVSMASEGTFNALHSLLAAAGGRTSLAASMLDYRSPFTEGSQTPPVWLTVTTPNGFWPLAVLPGNNLSQDDPDSLLYTWPENRNAGSANPVVEGVSRVWYSLTMVLLAACVAVGVAFRRPPGANGQSFFRLIVVLSLATIAVVITWPAFVLKGTQVRATALGLLLLLATAALLVLSGRRVFRDPFFRRGPGRVYIPMSAAAVAAFVLSLTAWRSVFHGGSHHEGFFAAWRSLDLVNGVAPNVPFIFLLLAVLGWALVSLRRLNLCEAVPGHLPELGSCVLDSACGQNLRNAREAVDRAVSLPFSSRALGYVAAVGGPVALYLGMNEYTQSLELRHFDLLYACSFAVVIMMLVLTATRLLVIWRRFREILRVIELHPVREFFEKISVPENWGPILHRSLRPEEMAAREMQIVARLSAGVNAPVDGTAESLRQNLLDPVWSSGRNSSDEVFLSAAELFALRFLRYIQAICRQMENLLLFLTTGFVLALISLNSYPFQSSHVLGWFMANLLAILGTVVGIVLAGTERDPVLSRINGTVPGHIGKDFYLNLLSYGALPLLTVVAAQFPAAGQFLFSWVQPMLQAFRG